MKEYKNSGGNSGVVGYDYKDKSITVRFKEPDKRGHTIYVYTYDSAGSANVEEMKMLADTGEGLNAFINANVEKRYADSY